MKIKNRYYSTISVLVAMSLMIPTKDDDIFFFSSSYQTCICQNGTFFFNSLQVFRSSLNLRGRDYSLLQLIVPISSCQSSSSEVLATNKKS